MAEHTAFITINGPGHDNTRVVLREGITSFGRLPSNDVILLGDLVSRNHARVIFFDGKASIQDLGSHNGSWVNEERVTTRALNPGDAVRIGNFILAFSRGAPGEAIAGFMDESTANGQAAFAPIPAANTQRPAGRPGAAEPPDPGLQSRAPGASRLLQEVSAEGHVPDSPGTLLLLYRVTEALSRASSLESFLTQVLSFTIERVGAELGAVFRVGADGQPERLLTIGPTARQPDGVVSSSVVRWAITKNFTVFSRDIAADVRFRAGRSVEMMEEHMRALVCAPIGTQDRVLGALYLARPLTAPFAESDIDAVEAIAHLVGAGMARIDDRQREIREALAQDRLQRTHGADAIRQILAEPRAPGLAEVEGVVTFAGIQGFTLASEEAPPDEVSAFLDAYIEAMTEAVHSCGGAMLPLLADEFVAVFGAPPSAPTGTEVADAVQAALAMRSAEERVAAQFPHLRALRLGVGIEAGRILYGATGPSRPWDPTVLGEPVRVAARLRALAPGGSVLVSPVVARALGDRFGLRHLGDKQLRPKHGPEAVIEVMGDAPAASRTELVDRGGEAAPNADTTSGRVGPRGVARR